MMATTAKQQISIFVDPISIPNVSRAETREISHTEIQRCINMLEQLSGDDWEQPTDCDEWTVKDMVAHLSGACAGMSRWSEFRLQYISNPYKQQGEDIIHGINRCQVQERKETPPEELIAELREYGPKAVNMRQRIPFFIREIRAPMPPLGVVPIRYLLDIIYPRDEWMHRADICRATRKHMELTEAHDGRILDLVAIDIARKMKNNLKGTIELTLTGDINRRYRFSTQSEPSTLITIDILEFNRRASNRSTVSDAMQVSQIAGDSDLAQWFFANCEVEY